MNEITLIKEDYETLKRVPVSWWDENETVWNLSAVTCESVTAVRRRLGRLIALGLVERRRPVATVDRPEIRRVGK